MTADIDLYGARTGNSFRAAIALEESETPYTANIVDLRSGAHQSSAFLEMNPVGKVPVLIDRRGERNLVLTQSNAIMMHVAETSDRELGPGTGREQRARFYERLFYFVTDVIAPSHAVFALESGGVPEGSGLLGQRSTHFLAAAQRFLGDGPFMVGDRFTLVDIAAVTIAASLREKIDWPAVPRLWDWFERTLTRPGVMKGMRAFDP